MSNNESNISVNWVVPNNAKSPVDVRADLHTTDAPDCVCGPRVEIAEDLSTTVYHAYLGELI